VGNFSGGGFKFGTAGVAAHAGSFVSTGGGGDQLVPLPAGFKISSGAAFGADLILFAKQGSPVAQSSGLWVAGHTAFAGIHNGPEFGWIRLVYSDNAQGYPDTITAIDWAYNTNGPINAGQGAPTATPEPGSVSLLALAAGATGILALRRRKKASEI
jgi:hypothetical protein